MKRWPPLKPDDQLQIGAWNISNIAGHSCESCGNKIGYGVEWYSDLRYPRGAIYWHADCKDAEDNEPSE